MQMKVAEVTLWSSSMHFSDVLIEGVSGVVGLIEHDHTSLQAA